MGMYDYLNGEQVKCFPIPMVYHGKDYSSDEEVDRVCFSNMGGLLRGFNIDDKVPYSTPIYNYGKNFLVFDYRGYQDELMDELVYTIHQIKGGKVYAKYTLEKIPEDIDLTLVIDNYGNALNIVSVKDFRHIQTDSKVYVEGYYRGIREHRHLFEDYIDSLREEEPREGILDEYNKRMLELRSKTIDYFHAKWSKNSRNQSNNIGYFISEIQAKEKSIEELSFLLREYIAQTKDYMLEVEAYKEWVKGYLTYSEVGLMLNKLS